MTNTNIYQLIVFMFYVLFKRKRFYCVNTTSGWRSSNMCYKQARIMNKLYLSEIYFE